MLPTRCITYCRMRILMNKLFCISIIVIWGALSSCNKRCDYVEPATVCWLPFSFDVRNAADSNIFITQYDLDSVQVFDETQQPTEFSINTFQNTFALKIWDCSQESEPLGSAITKVFFVQLNAVETDTLRFEFKPVPSTSECGGDLFEYINVQYQDSIYNIRNKSIVCVLER